MFTQRGKTLVTASSNGTFRTFSVAGKQPKQAGGFRAKRAYGDVNITASPSGNMWALTENKNIFLMDPTGVDVGALTGHKGHVRDVAFSPDGKLLASADDDGQMAVWSVSARTRRITRSEERRVGKEGSCAW